MGLDIYFHKVKRAFEGNPTENDDLSAFTDAVDKDAQEKLRKFAKKELKALKEIWEDAQGNEYRMADYNNRYFSFVEKLRKIIAKNYEFKIEPYTQKVLPYDELAARVEKTIEGHYEQYDAYFRKVNFIFHYFDVTIKKMHDQWFSFATTEDIDDLIWRCEQVLKDHKKAHELLPTQSGFFFGGTDYNDWYFYDVKDCLKQMRKFRRGMEGKTAYVIFSW